MRPGVPPEGSSPGKAGRHGSLPQELGKWRHPVSRAKLSQSGIELPLFPTTSVGSFPKPDYLTKGRARFKRGEISLERLRELEEEATTFWIRTQEELGMDVLVDGEMYRGDMVAFFAERWQGFEMGGLVRSYGNRYYHKPIITGELHWTGPTTVNWWKFAQNQTQRPVKGMLTGPYTLMDWSFNEFYGSRKDACMALARELRKEVEALAHAGARIIQIDEPAISARPEELTFAIEAMHHVTDGIEAYFITHICYGAFEYIYPELLKLPVDNFDLEMSNSKLDFLDHVKAYPFIKDLSFGVLDVHSHRIETVEEVRERLQKALAFLHKENVWVDPDCGLKTRTVDEAIQKLRVLVAAAKEMRGREGAFASRCG
ncbi:MAG: methionine synthase [Armatimonadetes bacterium]|nr:methionine synthase [Armatimonadota bacterium]